MRIKIGVDIDGVIADFMQGFSILARKKYGDRVPIITEREEVKTWDFSFLNITEDEAKSLFDDISKSSTFWIYLTVIDLKSWREFILEFNTEKYEVYFITNRTNGVNLHYQTVTWLNSVGWKNPQVIITDDKHDVINALRIDYFIDDNSQNCVNALMLTSADVYVYDYPHNENIEKEYFNSTMVRVSDLSEFKDHILYNLNKEKINGN